MRGGSGGGGGERNFYRWGFLLLLFFLFFSLLPFKIMLIIQYSRVVLLVIDISTSVLIYSFDLFFVFLILL